MAGVFISYSRKDIAFARLLHQALEQNALKAWIDWQDIPPTTAWLAEVYRAIEQADTFIFIISRTSVESDICRLEIAYAAENNKRLIPLVIDEVEPGRVTPELASLNWLFFLERDEFSQAFQDLIKAIRTDYAWVNEHTRLQVRALEWERKERDSGYLLRGRDLVEAEQWLFQAQGRDPQPTALHQEHIAASRKAAKRRRRITIGASLIAAAAIIAAVLAVIIIQTSASRERDEAQLSADLLQAANSGDLDAVRKALEEGAEVDARSKEGLTSLYLAASYGYTEMAELLLEEGADVDAWGGAYQSTPLHLAAQNGHAEMAELLLDAGADVDARNDADLTPLHWAAQNGHAEMADLLLEAGADVNAQAEDGRTPLHWAARYGHTEAAALLLEAGADVNARDDEVGSTPLHTAVGVGHAEMADLLLEAGADVNAQAEYGLTSLHVAAGAGNTEMAGLLLKAGADVNARDDEYDSTPLYYAVSGGHVETADLLRQHGGVE